MTTTDFSMRCRRMAVAGFATLCTLLPAAAPATDLVSYKLFGRWADTPDNYYLGQRPEMVALTEKWAVVSTHQANDRGPSAEGAVQVFNAQTGAWVRRIYPPLPNGLIFFGAAVAVSGDTALIGAPEANAGLGAAYVVDLNSGRVTRTLTGPGIMAAVRFGWSVAIVNDTLVVGAYLDNGGDGAVYLYKRSTGAFITKLSPPVAGTSEAFGKSLTGEGTVLAVGAPYADADRGAVYFYDSVGGQLIVRHQPAGSVAGDQAGLTLAMNGGHAVIGTVGSGANAFVCNPALGFDVELMPSSPVGTSYGTSVAVHGSLIAVGEPTANTLCGAVHLFQTETGASLQTVNAPLTPDAKLEFGRAIALHNNTLLVSAPADDTQNSDSGAAFLMKPFTQAMNFTKVMAQGDTAPEIPDVSVGRIGDAFINSQGETLFGTTLGGAGSNGGRDTAAITEVAGLGTISMPMKSRLSFGGRTGTVGRLTMNDTGVAVGAVTLTGTGFAAPANQMIWASIDGSFGTLIISGQTSASFGGGRFASVPEFVTSNQLAQGGFGAMITLKPESSTGTNANNDSGLLLARLSGMVTTDVLRENDPALGGSNHAQFAPRVSWFNNRIVYSSALRDVGITTANNAAVFSRKYLDSNSLVAQKGDLAVDTVGAVLPGEAYSTFVGETSFRSAATCYRATLSGVPVSRNDGLWRLSDDGTARNRMLLKGDFVGNPAGKVTRINGFWPCGTNNQLLVLVTIAGAGINASNDQVLVLVQSDLTKSTLLQEGSVAPGCGETARIGTIQRVEVDGWEGCYAVLATLTSAATGSNLALYTGNTERGNNFTQTALRRPQLRLRKGQLFNNQPGRLRSVSLPSSNRPASGAGGTGRGRAISWDWDFTFVAEFDNNVRQIMRGSVE